MKNALTLLLAALLIGLMSCAGPHKGGGQAKSATEAEGAESAARMLGQVAGQAPESQPKETLPKAAVYATGGRTAAENKALGARLTHALVGSGKYNTIERSDAFLDQVAKEVITQMSGAVDDEQISRLGQQAGADFVCIGEILEAFGSHQISARIVNVVSVEVIASGLASGQLKTMADLEALSDRAVALLLGVAQNATQPVSQAAPADKAAQSGDGVDFRTVKIGDLTWMAENLSIKTEGSWCYGDAEFNCKKYGRLYTWDAAMKVCPAGWHLPNNAEWDNLLSAAGGDRKVSDETDAVYYDAAGKKLKSKSGWNKARSASGDGTDEHGFSALGGGYRNAAGDFGHAGEIGYFWSATKSKAGDAYDWQMYHDSGSANEYDHDKGYGFSVRCAADE